MEEAENNPSRNKLGGGASEKDVLAAIEKSGYPLQTAVADILRSKGAQEGDILSVLEEWCFVDRDTQELRNLDMLATLRLHGWAPQPRVCPQLALLIECKQSQLPYVFFLAGTTLQAPYFPSVAGLQSDKVVITSDDDPSSWNYSVIHALDLDTDAFQRKPSFCHTLSKCVRKGGDIELSGSDAYNGVVLPLVKALQHFAGAQTPIPTARYFHAYLTVGVAVLDAPMVGVRLVEGQAAISLLPWTRVLRHEYHQREDPFERDKLWVLDVVHKDFFSEYLDAHLLPFAQLFAVRVLHHQAELATGRAFVPKMGTDGWAPVEGRMQPSSIGVRVSRASAIGKRILKWLSGQNRTDVV